MADFWLPRTPAFLEMHPSNVIWEGVSEFEAQNIQHWSGFDGPVKALKSGHLLRPGYYLVGSKSLKFVKVMSEEHLKLQLAANQVAEYVFSQGVLVSLLLNGFPKLLPNNQVLLAYEYVEGDFISPTVDNLEHLGRSIGKLHQALKKAPFIKSVRQAGIERFSYIQESFKTFKSNNSFSKRPEIAQLLQNYSPDDLSILVENAQSTHGDLNVGNLLATSKGILFLDFESSFSAWCNPLKELAFVIERFVLTRDIPLIEPLLNALLKGYEDEMGVTFKNANDLVSLLKALSVRSFVILMEMELKGKNPLESEWQKFLIYFC
ncbi:phosphotransferase [Thiomicrorhabdus aquaedulcis]|uniref:phosphotransferase n=1 Tax=Thiomicrorhabdus aquaedulcis TaxID=2211106 RepID=UPI000FD9088B|nr:phosphotransferase [Thiomicrorhabdus aquaedulcis]